LRAQQANRHIEKELASLDPYLALFEDEEKKQIKKDKFDLFFKGHAARPPADASDEPDA
jgi:hypothetical protein